MNAAQTVLCWGRTCGLGSLETSLLYLRNLFINQAVLRRNRAQFFCQQTTARREILLRASVNRERSGMKNGHEMFHHAGSSSRFPTKEDARARAATIPHRAYLRAISCPPARAKDEPSARMPPFAHRREGRLREAGAGPGVRLRLREDRRRILLGEHAASQAG